MAQQVYKVNTTESTFAYLSENQTRTIMAASGMEGGRENLPGVAYMHNVVPTEQGLQSVSYEPLIDPIPGLVGTVIDVREIYSLQRGRRYFAITSEGEYYRLKNNVDPHEWILVTPSATPLITADFKMDKLSTGRVNGVTYLYYPDSHTPNPEPPEWETPPTYESEAIAAYYDDNADEFIPVTLLGTSYSAVIGISASSGHLIAHTQKAMAWSSTLIPTDFLPSQETGAGGADVAGIGGNIRFCVPNSLGVIFYTGSNAIAATYTGNVRYPFKFREVAGSKGGINFDRIAYEANSDPQFVFTKGGIQAITSREAKPILPDITDFLTGRRIETLDTETWEYERYNLGPNEEMKKKVKYVSSRYLYFSYGVGAFTHAIMWDTALDKPGKLLIDHVDIFEYLHSELEVAKDTTAIVQADGAIYLVHSASDILSGDPGDQGVVVFGRLQSTRTRFMTLLGIELEGIGQFRDDISCIDLASITGSRNYKVVEGIEATDSPQEVYRDYKFCECAQNHNVAILGRFDMDTFLVRYTINGRR